MQGNIAATYTLIYRFLRQQSQTNAAEAVKKAAKPFVVLRDDIEQSGPPLEDIIKEWKAREDTKLKDANSSSEDSESSDEDKSSRQVQRVIMHVHDANFNSSEESKDTSGSESDGDDSSDEEEGTTCKKSSPQKPAERDTSVTLSSAAENAQGLPNQCARSPHKPTGVEVKDTRPELDSSGSNSSDSESSGSDNSDAESSSSGSGSGSDGSDSSDEDEEKTNEQPKNGTEPENAKMPKISEKGSEKPTKAESQSTSQSDSESEDESDSEPEQQENAKTRKISEKDAAMISEAESPSTSESGSESEDESDSEPEQKENGKTHKASENAAAKTREAKRESTSVSSSESGDESDSDSEQNVDVAKKHETSQKAAANGTRITVAKRESTSESSSESEDESEPEPERQLVHVAKRRKISENEAPVATAVTDRSQQSVRKKETPALKNKERFQRVKVQVHEQLLNNGYQARGGATTDYGERAHRDLIMTRGAGFRKEKNKKKRGSYRGGEITMENLSITFDF